MSDIKRQLRKFETTLNNSFREYIHSLGEKTLVQAQKMVPIDTGQLRSSAKLKKLPNGFQIIYDTDYARQLHEGTSSAKPVLHAPWKSSIPKHKRKLASGKVVTVRSHTKKYKAGYKPIQSKKTGKGMGWVARDVNMVRPPKEWLQEAWQIIRSIQSKHNQKFLTKALIIENK